MGCPGDSGPCKQLPEPSVPTRILLVEKFVMNPVSGKIDRKSLPNLSHLLRSAEPKAEDARRETLVSARDTGEGEVKPPDADAVWTLRMRKYWRSAGPCSRRSWDWMMGSLRLVGIRSSSRAWRSNCRLRDGRCLSGRCSVTATLHEKWRGARERSGGPPRLLPAR